MGMIGNSLAQGLISGANIQDGSVDTPDIKDGAVTAAKIADGAAVPSQTGQSGKFLTTDGTTASWGVVDTNLVADTTPQLGGNLDLNGSGITGTGNVSPTGNITSTEYIRVDSASGGQAYLTLKNNGNNSDYLQMRDSSNGLDNVFNAGGGVILNEQGKDVDFRVESASNPDALKLDAGFNSGEGGVFVGANGVPTTGVDYNIAASMLKFSEGVPISTTGAIWSFPSVPANRQVQDDRWRFAGFTHGYHGSDPYRSDASYAQFVCELPNGGPSGKTDLEVFEIGFSNGWAGGFYLVELFETYYLNSGYKKYIFHTGYDPAFTLYENYGRNDIALNVLTEGAFANGTETVPSTATDASYYRKTVRASYGAYWGGFIRLTVPSYRELTLNGAVVDTGNKVRLMNPQ